MRDWNLATLVDVDARPAAVEPGPVALGRPDGGTSRRTVMQGVMLSAATIGWLGISWTLPGAQRKAFAETGPGGLTGWNSNTCADAYPNGYSQTGSTDGSGYPASCFGSNMIGPTWCASGWAKKADVTVHNGHDHYRPISTSCGTSTTKNAWRWTTSGHIYRCSDGYYTYDRLGTNYGPYLFVCQYKVS